MFSLLIVITSDLPSEVALHETTVAVPSDTVTLAGAFAMPGSAGPFPTALLLAGSGPLDRDGNHKRIKLNLSRDLASTLAGSGWASLRLDKRGVRESGGDYLSMGLFDELADAEAALAWLQERGNVGPVVVIGHSAGSLLAGELAARDSDIAGAILLSASAKNGEETLRWQGAQISDHIVPKPVAALLRLFRTSVVKQQDKAIAKLKATTTDTARIQLSKVNAKWMREYIAYDPLPVLRRARVPMLAITGSKDVQVDPADLATIETATASTETLSVEGVDHILRREERPISNPRNYSKQIKKPVDPRVTDAITRWLSEHWPSAS